MSFSEDCYNVLRRVPRGKVVTYGQIARALKSKGYRAVGNAMNKSPGMPKVPCHRVVRSDGKIGGFAFGVKTKIKMLKSEGIEIRDGKIDLETYSFKTI